MDRAEKAARIQRVLDDFYPDAPIPLAHRNPFTLLVAVLLSAQTTDARVNLVTPALFARADTPEKMAKLSVAEIHGLIRTCGLAPAKAKAIAGLSKILVEKHGGEVPCTFEELEELPGVGHKTASVVMAQAFGIPAFPVDTHIHRLAQRWGLSDGSSVAQTERDLKAIFPRDRWIRLHLQIILFGREHCPALRHDPRGCPICSFASAKARAGEGSAGRHAGGAPASRPTGSASERTLAGGASASRPAGDASGRTPAGGTSTSRSAGAASGRTPAGGASTSTLAGGESASRPAGGASGRALAGGTSTSRSAGDAPGRTPAGGASASRPAGGASAKRRVKPSTPPLPTARQAASRTRARE